MEPKRSRWHQAETRQVVVPTIAEAGKWLREGSITSERMTESYLRRIKRLDSRLNAFISVTEELALTSARALDQELSDGIDRGPLHGIPIAYKDNFDTAGVLTTCGSKLFETRVPDKDAVIARRMKAVGTVMLGKTNMNELAAGGAGGFNKFFGSTRNPWHLDHESGGSSGGSGAAVAARMCLGALGTDTGGSIRGPASHMGIVGCRPTLGRIDLTGVFPRAPSMDCAGPLGATVRDVAILVNAMTGYYLPERADREPFAEDFAIALDEGVCGRRLGVIRNYTFREVDPDVAGAVSAAIDRLARLGAEIEEIEVPFLEGKLDDSSPLTVMLCEFNEIIGACCPDTAREGEIFGPIVRKDLERAATISRCMYEAALADRRRRETEIRPVFQNVDALLTPTMPTTAPPIERADLSGRHRQFTVPFSFLVLPAVSIPCGFDSRGLPIGLQIVGGAMREALILRIAAAFESVTDFHKRCPPFCCAAAAWDGLPPAAR